MNTGHGSHFRGARPLRRREPDRSGPHRDGLRLPTSNRARAAAGRGFVSFERWARDRRITRARSWAVIPDLAVEIISLTNTADEVAEKLEEYFRVGVRQVWVVYPRQSKVYVYRSTTAVQVLAPGDELEGGDLLPGFRLSGREVFEKAGEPA
ncbi:MAG: Uma2 family endonuclease [Isosphaeraceae bacterium]